MNYSETYFELDSEEATHCHFICCVYIKGHVKMVNTKGQSNAIMYCVCYRSGTVNLKSFIGKVLLQIKWKFELN